jgi:hypothetical protein
LQIAEVFALHNVLDRTTFTMKQNADLETFKLLLDEARINLNVVHFVSSVQYAFPINQVLSYYFTFKTKRKKIGIDAQFINELCLFIIVVIW